MGCHCTAAVKWQVGVGRWLRCQASFGRKHAFLDQPFAEFDAVLVVDVEQGDGDAADGGAADQVRRLPSGNASPICGGGG